MALDLVPCGSQGVVHAAGNVCVVAAPTGRAEHPTTTPPAGIRTCTPRRAKPSGLSHRTHHDRHRQLMKMRLANQAGAPRITQRIPATETAWVPYLAAGQLLHLQRALSTHGRHLRRQRVQLRRHALQRAVPAGHPMAAIRMLRPQRRQRRHAAPGPWPHAHAAQAQPVNQCEKSLERD